MSTTTAARAGRQLRPRKPLPPVQVTGTFSEGVTARQLRDGSAILEIADATGEAFYWARAVIDGRRLVGVSLQKFGTGARHHVHLNGDVSCDCEDAACRPDRPGGCKHVNAVRMAVVELARRLAKAEVVEVASATAAA
jgi:hypothetical protein